MSCPGHNHDELEREFTERSPAHAAFVAFSRAMHAHRQLMMRKLAEHDTPPAQIFCVKALSRNDGITQRDLAEVLHIARPTTTVMLQKMEKAGLVERRVDERDQRYTRIYLTQRGRALHDEIHDILDEIVESGIGPMPKKDQTEFARLLGEFAENIDTKLAAAAPNASAEEQATSGSDRHNKARTATSASDETGRDRA